MRESWTRAGLAALAAAESFVGVWALAAPRSFFADFPAVGSGWVSALPPYNEHLTRDVGALNLAIALLLAWAALTLERRLVQAASAAMLVYSLPHFVFHVDHLDSLSTGDQIVETAVLALALVIPVAVLASTRSRDVPGAPAEGGG